MTVGEKIKAARLKKGYSQTELAQLLGYKSRSSINKIEVNGRDIPRSSIVKFAKVLDVSPAYLMDWENEHLESNSSIYDKYENVFPIKTKKVPLLGSVACGNPIFEEEINSYIEADTDLQVDFCLRCKGDSMINARIYDGDIVFIKQMPMVDNGQIAAVSVENEVTLKRIYYYPEKNKLVLSPENSKYEPLVYINEELDSIRILGKAVAFTSYIN